MITSKQSWCWNLGLASWLVISGAIIASSGNSTLAQITPDTTLGNENSTVTSTGAVDSINGGATRGANLFHSFQEFNVDEGRAAVFTNPSGIENILTRVTGANPSNILGTLGVSGGNANLFLINPNGIIFGPNARLDVGGSFVASTASSLNFADGTRFSATAPQTTPLLTVSVPLGLQFGANPGRILVQGDGQGIRTTTELIDTTAGLRVQPERTLALVGGNIMLQGATLKTAGGRIELGSVAAPGLVNLTQVEKGWALGYEGVPAFGDIQMSGVAAVDASGKGGGDIQVSGGQVKLTNGSQIEASTLESEPGGTLTITASDLVELSGNSIDSQFSPVVATQVYQGATGAAGNVIIETGRLIIRDGGQILNITYGRGAAGSLTVNAEELVELSGGKTRNGQFVGSVLSTSVQPGAKGAGGNLTLTTQHLRVQNGAQIQVASFGTGAAGNLTVKAEELTEVIGRSSVPSPRGYAPSGLFTSTYSSEATGAAGNLILDTGRLIIRDGGQIQSVTFGAGAAGNLTVNVEELVELSGSRTLPNGQLASSVLSTSVQPGAKGAGGNLTLTTQHLSVRNGAQISSGTFGIGAGGNLAVTASNLVEVIGTSTANGVPSALTAQTSQNATGNAGDLTINTRDLLVRDGAGVLVKSSGTGNAGNLTINARSIDLDNNATLTADTRSNRTNPNQEQATITLSVRDLLSQRRGSNITTNATGENVIGGNININTDFLIAVEDSDISANSANFRGGQVRINASGIFGTQFRDTRTSESDITATGASPEFSGTVDINTLDLDPNSGLVNLPVVPVDTEVAQTCTPGGSQAQSEFVVTGRGGLPPNPGETLNTDAVQVDLITLNPQVAQPSTTAVSASPANPTPTPIVEAQGWAIDKNGEVILTANAPTVTPHNSWQSPADCHAPRNSS